MASTAFVTVVLCSKELETQESPTPLALHWTAISDITEKTGPFVISSYLCFGSYELHENFQKYIRRCCLLWIWN